MLRGLFRYIISFDCQLLGTRLDALHHNLAKVVEKLAQIGRVMWVGVLNARAPRDGVVGDGFYMLGYHLQLLLEQFLCLLVHVSFLHVNELFRLFQLLFRLFQLPWVGRVAGE